MPLHVRSIAVSIAVTCFFGVGIIGWISGVSPFICCKRALAGALLAYIVVAWAVKAVNAILMSAMITNQMNQQKEKDSGSEG
jgi:VIT1/CCC1 family predicted Fe2+/Mn2+ transporter